MEGGPLAFLQAVNNSRKLLISETALKPHYCAYFRLQKNFFYCVWAPLFFQAQTLNNRFYRIFALI